MVLDRPVRGHLRDFARYPNNGLASGIFACSCRRNIERPGQKPPSDCVSPRAQELFHCRICVAIPASLACRPAPTTESWFELALNSDQRWRCLGTQQNSTARHRDGAYLPRKNGSSLPATARLLCTPGEIWNPVNMQRRAALPTAPPEPELIFSACRRIEDGPLPSPNRLATQDRNRWQVYDPSGGAQEWTSSLFTVIGGNEVTGVCAAGGPGTLTA